jgi:dienelactone hydrolase
MHETKTSDRMRARVFETGATTLQKLFAFILVLVLQACSERDESTAKTAMLIRDALGETPQVCSEDPGRRLSSEIVSKDEAGTIKRISLNSCGERIHAYEAIPSKLSHATPVVIALHQTTNYGKEEVLGFGGNKDFAYGRFFLAQGFIVIAPDVFVAGENYRQEVGWDTSQFYAEHPQWSAMGRMLEDNLAVARYAREEHRFRCVAVVGHSLGGHNALFLGAFDDKIDVVVSSAGFESIATDERAKRWARDYGFVYMPRLKPTVELPPPREVSWDFDDVIRLILPREVMVIHGINDAAWTHPESVSSILSSAGHDRTDAIQAIVHSEGHQFGTELQKETADFITTQCAGRSRMQRFLAWCCHRRITDASPAP